MSQAIPTLFSITNHEAFAEFLNANDQANLARVCQHSNNPEIRGALTTSIKIPERMTMDVFNRVLTQYPFIREVDLSDARRITPFMLNLHHRNLTITRNPTFSIPERVGSVYERQQKNIVFGLLWLGLILSCTGILSDEMAALYNIVAFPVIMLCFGLFN